MQLTAKNAEINSNINKTKQNFSSQKIYKYKTVKLPKSDNLARRTKKDDAKKTETGPKT
jgi:hypothetical protein